MTFPEFIQTILATKLWLKNANDHPYFPEICRNLSLEINNYYELSHVEPSYHSRKHFIDVCLAVHLLLLKNEFITETEQSSWYLSPIQSWHLLISAMAHDFGHNGLMNQSIHQQELLSIQGLNAFLDTQIFPGKDICQEVTTAIILATDPKDRAQLMNRIHSSSAVRSFDQLSMLMVEADLFASTLPKKGVELGNLLSEEISSQDPQLSEFIKSPKGRLGFLNSVQFLSPQSHILGAPQILKEAISMTQHHIKETHGN